MSRRSPFPLRAQVARPLVLPFLLALASGCGESQAEASRQASSDSAAGAAVVPAADSSGAGAPGSGGAPAGSVSPGDPAAPVRGADSGATATAAPAAGSASVVTDIVRGIYVNRFAAQSPRRMAALIRIADSTEINAFVIDVKDEFGLNYATADEIAKRNAGRAGSIPNLRALLDTLKAHDILPIARIVVFKDSVAARVNPDRVIRKPDGGAWRDKQGLTWVNPYDEQIWEYNIRVAEEVVQLGFGEVQFDYIRFPEPYPSLPKQIFPNEKGRGKPQVLADFLRTANARLDKLGVRTTADVFGLVTSVRGALEIGQEWEVISPAVDVMLPMTYPSHYPRGALGVARPNADPYKIQYEAIRRAKDRDDKLGLKGERVRPWIQAFTLGQPPYGAAEVKAQMKGIYDAGYEGWVWWHPGSKYEPFVGALERTLEKKVGR